MKLVTKPFARPGQCEMVDLSAIEPGITEEDIHVFSHITDTQLSPQEHERIVAPPYTYPQQREVLATHWHPEHVPMALTMERIKRLYPNGDQRLIIPTQHNVLMTLNGYAGVEVDCYSSGFNRKVQLLLHFREDKVADAPVLASMLQHTFRYRTSQLMDYLHTMVDPSLEDRLQRAAAASNTEDDIVAFCRIYAAKILKLVEDRWDSTPQDTIKNKLVRNFFDGLRDAYGDRVINRSQVFLKAVKEIVKAGFSLRYFYRASEFIEETRGLGGGIVIPHPEQFWPILLADYDVDGIEVWNPQSRDYTEFLIKAVQRQNRLRKNGRPVLIFMGDDTHMSEKLRDPSQQDAEKASREVGLQPAWDDLSISKSLTVLGISRSAVISHYQARLG